MTWADIIGRSQKHEVVLTRHAVCYFLWRKYPLKLREIGDLMGGRSPAPIYHTIQCTMRRMGNGELPKLAIDISP